MSNAEYENLSALMDGELSHEQIRFMLRRTSGNAALCATWDRYHIIRDGMRHEVSLWADDDFVARVMDGIHEQADAGNMPARPHHRWLRWSAGGAIAAGVAVAALVAVQPQVHRQNTIAATGTEAPASVQVATTNAPARTEPQAHAAPVVPRWLSASPSAAQMAQPAAATFYSGGGARPDQPQGYYWRGIAPYMTLPAYRTSNALQAREIMHQLWSMGPHPMPVQQPQARIRATQ